MRDRDLLERDYDRPSLHHEDWATRTIGRTSAIMEQHIASRHAQQAAAGSSFAWSDLHCELCGYDVRAELFRLYPEYEE